jgi:hypothetical protein
MLLMQLGTACWAAGDCLLMCLLRIVLLLLLLVLQVAGVQLNTFKLR